MTSQLHPKENRAISRKELDILKSLKTIKIPFTCDVLRMGEVFDLLLLDVLSQGALVSSNNIYTKTVISVLLRNNSIFQLRTFDAAFCCRRIFRRKIANFAQLMFKQYRWFDFLCFNAGCMGSYFVLWSVSSDSKMIS